MSRLTKFRAKFEIEDDKLETIGEDEIVCHAADFEEAARIAEAFAFGLRRNPDYSDISVISIARD